MFGKRRFNLFGDFESLFNEMNSMFDNTPYYVKGKTNVENGKDKNGEWTKESFISDDGTYVITTVIRTNLKGVKPETSNNKIDYLKQQLETAVTEQEFEKAAELRDQIKNLEKNQDKLNQLKSELDDAISKQDFENAIKLRDDIKKLES